MNSITRIGLGVASIAIAVIGTITQPAHADQHWTMVPSHGWQQPYGGCDEAWQAPASQGADDCRDHGWTVTGHIVIGPNGWVRAIHRLPACANDEAVGGPCVWLADRMGNHEGRSFWLTPSNEVRYIRGLR